MMGKPDFNNVKINAFCELHNRSKGPHLGQNSRNIYKQNLAFVKPAEGVSKEKLIMSIWKYIVECSNSFILYMRDYYMSSTRITYKIIQSN